MNFGLNVLSILSAAFLSIGLLYLTLEYVIVRLNIIDANKAIFRFRIIDVVSLIIAIAIILCFFDFIKPFSLTCSRVNESLAVVRLRS